MNKSVLTAITTVLLLCFGKSLLAHGNEVADAKATISNATVSIHYARPSLKGRDLSKMIQPGELWRLGADFSTTFESDADLDFGGTRVPKGKYILLARFVEPGTWALVFSTKSAFDYQPSAKVAEVPLDLHQAKDSVEDLSIKLSNQNGRGGIEIAWGPTHLATSFVPAR
jgi:hypothetical protein